MMVVTREAIEGVRFTRLQSFERGDRFGLRSLPRGCSLFQHLSEVRHENSALGHLKPSHQPNLTLLVLLTSQMRICTVAQSSAQTDCSWIYGLYLWHICTWNQWPIREHQKILAR